MSRLWPDFDFRQFTGGSITPRPSDQIDRTVRRVTKQWRTLKQEVLDRQHHLKPSEARRRKRARAQHLRTKTSVE
jgi:ribosomal protein S21